MAAWESVSEALRSEGSRSAEAHLRRPIGERRGFLLERLSLRRGVDAPDMLLVEVRVKLVPLA